MLHWTAKESMARATHTHTDTHTHTPLSQMRGMKEKGKEKYDSKPTLTTVQLSLHFDKMLVCAQGALVNPCH